jgi:hypothetical protein
VLVAADVMIVGLLTVSPLCSVRDRRTRTHTHRGHPQFFGQRWLSWSFVNDLDGQLSPVDGAGQLGRHHHVARQDHDAGLGLHRDTSRLVISDEHQIGD